MHRAPGGSPNKNCQVERHVERQVERQVEGHVEGQVGVLLDVLPDVQLDDFYLDTPLYSEDQGFMKRVEVIFSFIWVEISQSSLPLLQQGFSLEEQQQSV